jgi:hypothetical protein
MSFNPHNIQPKFKPTYITEMFHRHFTGRKIRVDNPELHYGSKEFEDPYWNRPLEPTKGLEVVDTKMWHETIKDEIAFEARLAYVGHLNPHHPDPRHLEYFEREMVRNIAQALYAPLLDDLSAIEHLAMENNREGVIMYLQALKGRIVGASYG